MPALAGFRGVLPHLEVGRGRLLQPTAPDHGEPCRGRLGTPVAPGPSFYLLFRKSLRALIAARRCSGLLLIIRRPSRRPLAPRGDSVSCQWRSESLPRRVRLLQVSCGDHRPDGANARRGCHLTSQSPELAVFETKPSSTANVLIFGIFGEAKSKTITMTFHHRESDGLTAVSIYAENGRLGPLLEELRDASEVSRTPAPSRPLALRTSRRGILRGRCRRRTWRSCVALMRR